MCLEHKPNVVAPTSKFLSGIHSLESPQSLLLPACTRPFITSRNERYYLRAISWGSTTGHMLRSKQNSWSRDSPGVPPSPSQEQPRCSPDVPQDRTARKARTELLGTRKPWLNTHKSNYIPHLANSYFGTKAVEGVICWLISAGKSPLIEAGLQRAASTQRTSAAHAPKRSTHTIKPNKEGPRLFSMKTSRK